MQEYPEWLKVKSPSPLAAEGMRAVRKILEKHSLTTVCQEALCPNAVECWGARTATFMLLGGICTRACRFCAVPTGNPEGRVDSGEPRRLEAAVAELGLSYVVITSVDRDDLADGGAGVFTEAIQRIKSRVPHVRVEALVPDFGGKDEAMQKIAASAPDVIGHNLETVRRLSPRLRDARATYDLSLHVLAEYDRVIPNAITKSSLMLGMGEEMGEIVHTLDDLRSAGVDALTLGQYMQPTASAVPVTRYLNPEEFDSLADKAKEMGFCSVVAGPLVRSSYRAAEVFKECSV